MVVEVRELKSGSEEKERGSEVALGAATLGEKWAAIVEARCGREKELCFLFQNGRRGALVNAYSWRRSEACNIAREVAEELPDHSQGLGRRAAMTISISPVHLGHHWREMRTT